jgi:hypothetical protein
VLSEVVDPDIHSSDLNVVLSCVLLAGGWTRGRKRGPEKIRVEDFGSGWGRGEGGVARGFEVGKISGPERSVNFEFLSCIVEWFGCLVRN